MITLDGYGRWPNSKRLERYRAGYGFARLNTVVEQEVSPPCARTVKDIRSMVEHFKAVPDFRGRFESYPLRSMYDSHELALQ